MTTRHKRAGQSEKNASPAPLFDHHFRRPELLTWALTHRSLAYETNPDSLPNPTADNEQLEFVGDAVLGLVVAESLFHRFSASSARSPPASTSALSSASVAAKNKAVAAASPPFSPTPSKPSSPPFTSMA